MAVSVPIPLKASNIVSIVVSGGNDGTAGAITWSTGVDLSFANGTGAYENFRISPKKELMDATPTDSPYKIMLPGRIDLSLTIEEIRAADGGTALELIAAQYDYIKVIALYRAKGASTGGVYQAAMGVISDADFGLSELVSKNTFKITTACMGKGYYTGTTLPTMFT